MIGELRASHPAARASAAERPWLGALRAEAWGRVDALGLPTTRDEAWRYTSLRALAAVPYRLPEASVPADLEARVAGLRVPHAIAELVIVDGRVVAAASRWPEGAGVELAALASVLPGEGAPGVLGAVAPWREAAMPALNTALLLDGVVLRVAAGVEAKGPVHLIVVSGAAPGPVGSSVRAVVELAAGARVDVVETHVSADDAEALCSVVVEAEVGDGAALGWQVVGLHGARTHLVHGLWVRVGRDARVATHGAWLGGAITRSDVGVRLVGRGAEACVDGLYVLDGDAHTDVHTEIEHAVPHTTSREGYKAVLGGSASGVFDGRVIVRPDAQRTDAVQDCRAMLVSCEAEMSAKPTLEILADDVKCAHGTAVGQLDRTQLAYLTSRGIPRDQATRILTAAFVADRVDRVADPLLRERLDRLVQARLARVQEPT